MSSKNVLVVAAHPDDEVLGCGATISKLVSLGHTVHILIVAEGSTSRTIEFSPDTVTDPVSMLIESANKACSLLHADKVETLGLRDNRLDSYDLLDIVQLIELKISTFKPAIVFTHHDGDVNIDHQLLNRAVITATRPSPSQVVKTVLAFEILSSTEWQFSPSARGFQPNVFVDVTHFIQQKLDALHAYEQEMRDWPHTRSYQAVESLAKLRGAQVGVDLAEAFMLLRTTL